MILETVLLGSVAGIISNIATDSGDIFARRLKEGLKSGTLPANHDMELAIRSACLRASRVVLDVIQTLKSPDSLPFLGHRADIKGFVKAADNFLVKQQKNTKSEDWYKKLPEFYAETLDKKVVDAAFAKFKGPMARHTEMDKLAAIVLKEIADGIAVDCPMDVTKIFYDDKRGWPEAFRYCLGEELKTKERFRTIYMGFKINDLEARLIEQHEEILSQLQAGIDPDLAGYIQKTLDGIEAKTDQILENQKDVNQFIERHSQELESLRKEEKLSNRAIGQLLFEMGVMEEAPDRISEALKFAVHQYREIKRKLDRPTNAISPHKSLMNDARTVFVEGKMHEARAFIQRYNIKQAAWRQEQQEMFEQSAREQSEGLEMEAEFAISLRDVEGARNLYEQAVTVLPASCADEIEGMMYKAFAVFNQFGTTFPSTFALDTALYFIKECLKNIEIEKKPQAWAAAQNNLGIVLSDLGIRLSGPEGLAKLFEAQDAYEAALGVYSEKELPQDWARTQNNRGNVLKNLGTRLSGPEGLEKLFSAQTACESALRVRTEKGFPQAWAMAQNNLATVLSNLGTRLSGPEGLAKLFEAQDAYEAALRVYSEKELPQDWAMTRNNLGAALRELGTRLSGPEGLAKLFEAQVSYEVALRVYSEKDFPQAWAMIQNNLGTVFSELGTRLSGPEGVAKLFEAQDAYEAALRVRSEKELPQDWAMTRNNLGTVFSDLGTRLSGPEGLAKLFEAQDAYEAALRER
ncbi:MAG: hypothetical protein JKY91_01915, partial [Emcibacter sp.]|nr:hypothetical protein [Emcibacter sp.]